MPSWRGQGQYYLYIYRGICLDLKHTKTKEQKNIRRTNAVDPFREHLVSVSAKCCNMKNIQKYINILIKLKMAAILAETCW